ncbi:hypothetical protein [Actinomadura alba]|uniref:hypothetical protein n=1 Tax=Actinomadura alba TaxID=406431 RepID=UPI0031D6BB6D
MRAPGAAAAMLSVCAAATACSADETALRQITPNAVVYIDGWDQDGDQGDRALVEQKPSGMWVLPANAPFRTRSGGDFTVKVTLDPQRGFVVTDLGGVRVGKDHDDCLADGETYAFLGVPASSLRWEPERSNPDTSNDDCVVRPEG